MFALEKRQMHTRAYFLQMHATRTLAACPPERKSAVQTFYAFANQVEDLTRVDRETPTDVHAFRGHMFGLLSKMAQIATAVVELSSTQPHNCLHLVHSAVAAFIRHTSDQAIQAVRLFDQLPESVAPLSQQDLRAFYVTVGRRCDVLRASMSTYEEHTFFRLVREWARALLLDVYAHRQCCELPSPLLESRVSDVTKCEKKEMLSCINRVTHASGDLYSRTSLQKMSARSRAEHKLFVDSLERAHALCREFDADDCQQHDAYDLRGRIFCALYEVYDFARKCTTALPPPVTAQQLRLKKVARESVVAFLEFSTVHAESLERAALEASLNRTPSHPANFASNEAYLRAVCLHVRHCFLLQKRRTSLQPWTAPSFFQRVQKAVQAFRLHNTFLATGDEQGAASCSRA